MKKILALLLAVLTLFCLCSCGEEPEPTPPDTNPGHGVDQDTEAHYLIFVVENIEIERMLAVSTDTFENLEPYFPTIPEKAGYNSYWEETVVYSDTQKEVYINAYYVKKQ
jgi:hypothetical protein